jgi:hypothetical protein
MLAEWTPALTSLLPSTSQTAPVAAAQAAPPAAEAAAAADQTADQSAATPPAVQVAAAPQPDATQSVQSMTRDLGLMAQQIEALKASIAELKAGQEQMAREMAKPPAPKPGLFARAARAATTVASSCGPTAGSAGRHDAGRCRRRRTCRAPADAAALGRRHSVAAATSRTLSESK